MCACVKREERNAMPMLRAETGRYTQRAMQASPYVATAGVIAGGGAAGINFLTSVPEKLGEGLQAAEKRELVRLLRLQWHFQARSPLESQVSRVDS